MSRYTVYLQDRSSGDGSTCHNEVQLTLVDPVWGDNTWSITMPNSWIGIGSGTYTVKLKIEKVLTILTAVDSGGVRFELYMQEYPGSLDSGAGMGAYNSSFQKGTFRLRWYGVGAIRPEPCPT